MKNFGIEISYSQIAVFDNGLEDPFNNWNDQHVSQGFSWRPGSVSFQTPATSGRMNVEVSRVDELIEPVGERVIKVPFSCVVSDEVCIASISDSRQLRLAPKKYQLFYQAGVNATAMWCRLTFVECESPVAEVLKLGPGRDVPSDLLMLADPA